MEDIILIGYGGHARSVADCIERRHAFRIAGYTEFVPQDSESQHRPIGHNSRRIKNCWQIITDFFKFLV